MLCLLVLSSPFIFHANALQSPPRNINAGKLVSNAQSRLTFLTPESQDGTILVSLNDGQPPFRVAVLDLILNLDVKATPHGFVVGSSVDIDMSALDTIPKISPSFGLTRGSRIEPLLRFLHMADVRKTNNHLSQVTSHRKEGNEKSQSHGTLRSQYYSQGGTYKAAQLLDISYVGKSNLEIGDALTWKVSVLQGDAPLASISINLVGPYDTYHFKVVKDYPTPIGFGDSSMHILNGTVTSIITNPLMDGSYSITHISLRTQACPLGMSTNIFPSRADASVMTGDGTATAGSQLSLSAFNLMPLTFGSGLPPNVTCPSLLSFQMESAPVVSIGDEVRWNFTVRLGTYPLAPLKLYVRGPLLQGGSPTNPQGLQTTEVTALVDAGSHAGEGSIVAGTISVPVTSAWISGEYNSASIHPMLSLAVIYPPFSDGSVVDTIIQPNSAYFSNALPGCTVPPAPFFSADKLVFVVAASRPTPPLSSAQLLSFRYTGPAEVRAGDSLTWEYSILQVCIHLCSLVLYILCCHERYVLPQLFWHVYHGFASIRMRAMQLHYASWRCAGDFSIP
jgi:hypothetical protein